MANVTDSASLLTVPSGWDDGVLGSLKPDDGTGDFTFSRGSDLSATRVNEDGYIERGYENLLLQSNNFSLSPWILKPGTTLTSGIADPDGGTNAWQLNFDGTANARIEQQLTVINNSVYTFSFYARVSSGTKDISVGAVGSLTTKTLTTEWQRIEHFGATTTTITFPQIRTKDTSVYSIEIYQAQFNQGLVAYPYIETTTATAKNATILEDQPRIDYSNGANGNILVEPQATNGIKQSEYFGGLTGGLGTSTEYDTSILNPSGSYGVYKEDEDGARFTYDFTGLSVGQKVTYSIFAKSSSTADFWFGGMFGGEYAIFNVVTGAVVSQGSAVDSAYSVNYGNGWRRFVVAITFSSPLGNNLGYPGFRWRGFPDYVYVWGMQAELDVSDASSYIPTYGTSTTRLKETATLTKNVASTGTIYINIEAQKSRTLTFLGANISVTVGTNKIAMSYSPTALKVSHNGSIVANTARTFDTASLTQIQLGHRNNFEQTTDGINQFLTLDSFLSDADLNALTI